MSIDSDDRELGPESDALGRAADVALRLADDAARLVRMTGAEQRGGGVARLQLRVRVGDVAVDLKLTGEGATHQPTPRGRSGTLGREVKSSGRWENLLSGPADANPPELATAILQEPRIALATVHSGTPTDGATASDNVRDTASGTHAKRSQPNPAGSGDPPGGSVALSGEMLAGMLALSAHFAYSVSEIAGGKHPPARPGAPASRHYAGVAFDVNVINGRRVDADHPDLDAFQAKCLELGATEVRGPGDDAAHATHVHAGWPRP